MENIKYLPYLQKANIKQLRNTVVIHKLQCTNMYGDIFVFGTKIFDKEPKRDAITTLPLELSWKIFSYLDDASLQIAFKTHKVWARIISSNKNLQKRLDKYGLYLLLGSRKMVKFHRRNKRMLKKEGKRVNFVPRGESVHEMIKTTWKSKRSGSEFIVYTKRLKLF